MSDIRHRIDIAAAIDRGLHMHALAETPIALDHRIGCIDAIDDDGNAGPAGHHDRKAAAGQSRATSMPINNASATPTRIPESRFLSAAT